MTEGIKSHTTTIALGDGSSPESFDKVDEVFSIGPVGGKKTLIDFSNHDSVDFMEYQVGDLADGDEIAVEANEIPGNTSQEAVRTANTAAGVNNWQVTYRDGTTETFPGIITALQTDPSELDGRVVFRFTVKIAGAIDRSLASPGP
jgi:hypothetical protein